MPTLNQQPGYPSDGRPSWEERRVPEATPVSPLLLTPTQQGDPLPLQAGPQTAGAPVPHLAVQSWSEGLGPLGEWGPDPLWRETPLPKVPQAPTGAEHQEGSFTKGLKPETVTPPPL